MRIASIARTINRAWAAIGSRRRRRDSFTCGDCERWERCGLPPNETCVEMLAQVARGEQRWPRPHILNP